MVATCSSPSGLVAAIDETTTGEALMLSAWTVGVAVSGRDALASASWIAAVVSGTLVPNANWVTTSEIELDDVDWISSSRGIAPMARSIGRVTCSRTSEDPAPGYGVTTVTTGNSMSGRSSCLRLPQAEIPATKRAAANRSVTLRLLTARRLRRLTTGSPGSWLVMVTDRSMARPRMSTERPTTSSSSASSRSEQLAELTLVELTEALEQGDRLGRRGDHHLAPVVRVVVATEQPELDQPIGQPAGR